MKSYEAVTRNERAIKNIDYVLFLNGESYGSGDIDYMRLLITDYLMLFNAHEMDQVEFTIKKLSEVLRDKRTEGERV